MSEQKPVFEVVREIIVDALGVDGADIRRESRLVADLGAESIDFLDISFRLEEVYNVSLPTRAWTELFSQTTGQLAVPELVGLVSEDFGVTIPPEQVQGYAERPIGPILDDIQTTHGVTIDAAHRRRYAELGTKPLLDQLGAVLLSPIDGPARDHIVEAATLSGFDENFWRAMATVFTVGRLVHFIEQRLAVGAEAAA